MVQCMLIAVAAALVNNVVLSQFLGLCPFLGVSKKTDTAAGMGAEELITACPLCLYNLNTSTSANKLPVHYFTELLAEALGLKEEVQE